jgi:hypothetical protein
MSLWRQMTRGVRALTNRTAADQDVAPCAVGTGLGVWGPS